MPSPFPIAASLRSVPAGDDPVVVEADPEGDATRSVKDLARYVYRFIQEVRWAGHEGVVSVGVAGDQGDTPPIGVNLGLLLSPLVTTGLGERTGGKSAFDLLGARRPELSGRPSLDALPSPRDRVWIVPAPYDRDPSVWELFELYILEVTPEDQGMKVDLLLVHGEPAAGRQADGGATSVELPVVADEVAVVTTTRGGPKG
ncbi:MAG: hypothetical protein QNJ71_01965 [Acidimicrobiia bacterium]|nr:hypothetical protein [Acidimicrobiia bacterium]